MDGSQSRESLPIGVLLGAGALIVLTLFGAGAARVSGIGTTPNPESSPVERRLLHFDDRADGAVVVYGEDRARIVEVLEPGTHGFVRSVLRGFARDRRSRGIGREPGFELTRWADGRLSLADPSTGRSVELDPFGPDNSGAFARILGAAAATR